MALSRRAVSLATLAAILGVRPAGPLLAQARPVPQRGDTHVYLMRGLFGIYSLGMDDLAGRLKEQGYRADVYGWDSWQEVAHLIVRRYDDGHRGGIVVVGHSLGANSVFSVADYLHGRNIPVLLGVTFDATEPGQVPNNVHAFINFWARDGFGHPVSATPGYTGELDDFDLSGQPGIDHTTIDAVDRWHRFIIDKLSKLTGG